MERNLVRAMVRRWYMIDQSLERHQLCIYAFDQHLSGRTRISTNARNVDKSEMIQLTTSLPLSATHIAYQVDGRSVIPDDARSQFTHEHRNVEHDKNFEQGFDITVLINIATAYGLAWHRLSVFHLIRCAVVLPLCSWN